MMPKWARDCLEARITEDLSQAVVASAYAVLQDDGTIRLDELVLKIPDGREVAIASAGNRPGSAADLRLEVLDPDLMHTASWGWRRVAVTADYADEIGDILTEGKVAGP